jgi:hypothetical protein
MATNTKIANATRSAQANALGALLDSGIIRVYSGSQPATADTAITDQTLLVTLTFGETAFPAADDGVLTANAITSGTVVADGTAAWCRILRSDGTTVVMDGNVGTSGSNLNIATLSLSTGATVSASSFTHTTP